MANVSNSGDIDWLIDRLVTLADSFSESPWVLGISGHAAVGKTALAEGLVHRWQNAVRLETECCILDFAERSRLQLSGCRVEAHNLVLYSRLIDDLLEGRTVRFRSYDWQTRARTGDWVDKSLPANGILLLDGTILPHPTIAARCNNVVFLKPANYPEWLDFAVDRDFRERFRSRRVATLENELKYLDTSRIEQSFRSNISDVIVVSLASYKPSSQTLEFAIQQSRSSFSGEGRT
jgi:uridine kinase